MYTHTHKHHAFSQEQSKTLIYTADRTFVKKKKLKSVFRYKQRSHGYHKIDISLPYLFCKGARKPLSMRFSRHFTLHHSSLVLNLNFNRSNASYIYSNAVPKIPCFGIYKHLSCQCLAKPSLCETVFDELGEPSLIRYSSDMHCVF